jgi:autotransporter translocation and assembly factor TamB
MQGKVPLQPVGSFLPWLRIGSGEADLDIRMTGPLPSPRLEGSASLAADRVSIQGYDYPFDHVEARLHGSPEEILLDSFVARTGDGEIRATGRSSFGPFSVESLEAQIISLPVRLSQDLLGRIAGNLSFKGNAQSSRLAGRMRILEARYSRDFQVVGAVLKPARPSPVSVRKPSAFLSNMTLDLHVASGPDLFVENNVARIILSMDMDFQGTVAAPVPLGKVEAVEGKLYLLKKQFEITEGSLSFLDPTTINPMLHVESRVEVRGAGRDYLVYLSLDGPLDRIELELRSIPELLREDILFVLVTGKTQAEYLASGPGDAKSGATQLAVSGISLLFGEDIRRATGLDVFEMEAGEGQDQGLKTILGKRVNERMELRGVFAIGSSHQASEAQVEYRLTDTIFLVGTQRTDGSFGLDVRLRFFSK